MVEPIQQTLSPVMTGRGLSRRFDTVDMPLADLKRAGARLECSVNDVFLAALTGGLRYYHEEHGAELSELRIALPISLRTAEDDIGGNRVTLVRFVLPVGSPDPRVRIAAARRLVAAWRNAPSNQLTQGIAFALNLAPRNYIGEMIKRVDLLASNVPGLRTPVYLAGARITGYYPFGPTLGSALNVTLMSYVGTCSIGINADTAAVPDLDVLVRCLHAGFDEVLECPPAYRSTRHPA
jgi:WS/DGAT/MGAT family acyltransferase